MKVDKNYHCFACGVGGDAIDYTARMYELYEEFQRIYDESVGRDAGKEKAEDKMWNMGRGR